MVQDENAQESLNEQELLRKAQLDAEAVLRKFDTESNTRTLTGFFARLVTAIAITFSLFQLYTSVFGVMDAHLQRAIHLSFGMALIFLMYPTRSSWSKTSSRRFYFSVTYRFGSLKASVKKAQRGIENDDVKSGGGSKE